MGACLQSCMITILLIIILHWLSSIIKYNCTRYVRFSELWAGWPGTDHTEPQAGTTFVPGPLWVRLFLYYASGLPIHNWLNIICMILDVFQKFLAMTILRLCSYWQGKMVYYLSLWTYILFSSAADCKPWLHLCVWQLIVIHCSGDDLSSLCIVWQIKKNSWSSSVHLLWRGCC